MALEAGSRPVFPDSLTSLTTFSRTPIARTARYASRNPVTTQHVTNSLTSLSLNGLKDKVTIMAELKVYLPDDLDTRFREAALSAFGYGRGSLSKAAAEALAKWCSEREDVKSSEPTNVPKDELAHVAATVETVRVGLSRQDDLGGSSTPAS